MFAVINQLFLKRLPMRLGRHYTSLPTDLLEKMDKKETWDLFYLHTNGDTGCTQNFKNFEWFFGFDTIQNLILPWLQPNSRSDTLLSVLDMGCGTSALGPSIYKLSPWPVQVTCADISPVAVRLMQEHMKSKPIQPRNPASRLAILELDCCEIQTWFCHRSLDLIVDKGTTDALLRSREGKVKAGQVLRQCLEVLRHSGALLQFSDEDPDARLPWLEKRCRGLSEGAAEVTTQEVGVIRGICYYCYLITPPAPAL